MDDGFHVPLAVGVMALLEHACDTAIPSALLPFIQSVLRYRLKTLLEIERMHALPSWLCRNGAPMPWVGFVVYKPCHESQFPASPGGAGRSSAKDAW
jgi:hypothetical protein